MTGLLERGSMPLVPPEFSPLSSLGAAEPAPEEKFQETPLTKDDFEHWAFRPLARVKVPDSSAPHWARGPIDRFIRDAQDAHAAKPLHAADRRTLVRRLAFDLTGLPPTPELMDEVLSNDGPDAIERLVDRLLASPAHGQRWAQFWLDLARYADTDGFERDNVRPNAWRYRDWVIAALNGDLPYDEFVRQQIAGDLLRPDDAAAVTATGFLLCGPDMIDLNFIEERRHNVLNEMTGVVGAAFLGLQLACAECHHHKHDPLSQGDFYRLRAFFESLDLFREHKLPRPQHSAGTRVRNLLDSLDELGAAPPPPDPLALSIPGTPTQRTTDPDLLARVAQEGPDREAFFYVKGDYRRPGARVSAEFPRVANPQRRSLADEATLSLSGDETQPRAALAKWLARPDRSLLCRVIVNRVWQEHFGRGIVGTPSDFGVLGEPPTHPELLEWLAAELPRRGWSLKQLHRALVLSSTYRQASAPAADEQPKLVGGEARRWLVGMTRRRLDGESLRDAMLSTSGRLAEIGGGPSVRPPLPTELVATLLKDQWDVAPAPVDHVRRSVYLFTRRNLRYPLFEAFDRPDRNSSCAQRQSSTIAPQALTLFNSELTLQCAEALARRVRAET
ncbi:MAG TPA: DUF1549 and DUF1553 domain-containing protein, partial [Pirellulaceae bacterium]|nr:DUF1549 and DUF1553 domain-containing protein [Pirellulaceae bacterium]